MPSTKKRQWNKIMSNHINSIIKTASVPTPPVVGADLCVCPFLYQIMGE